MSEVLEAVGGQPHQTVKQAGCVVGDIEVFLVSVA